MSPQGMGDGAAIHPSAHVHASAVIDDGATIGEGSRIWHFCHVSRDAHIGARCVLGQNVFVGPGVRVGDGVKIQNNVSIYVGVELEDHVFLGPSCVFTNVDTPRAHVERKSEFEKTPVRKGATIGANATIVCGHEIGRFAFVGAGCVVTKDVPAHALVVGNPSRRIGWVCECGERLPPGTEGGDGESIVACGRCGLTYRCGSTCVRVEAP